MTAEHFDELEEVLGYRFRDRALLATALTHGSAKSPSQPSNERLEFLGDAVLGFVVSDFLFAEAKEIDEGRMTKVKAQVVSMKSLTAVALDISLAQDLSLGRMFQDVSQVPPRVLGNAVEALIGAIWLDGGLSPARRFIDEFFGAVLDEALEAPGEGDFKSRLGQLVQGEYHEPPTYHLEEVEGLDHALTFQVGVVVLGEVWASARGRSKKTAEQEAARLALETWERRSKIESPAASKNPDSEGDFGAGIWSTKPKLGRGRNR